jgi:hypothetical protein
MKIHRGLLLCLKHIVELENFSCIRQYNLKLDLYLIELS